jgi:hypothetical protein
VSGAGNCGSPIIPVFGICFFTGGGREEERGDAPYLLSPMKSCAIPVNGVAPILVLDWLRIFMSRILDRVGLWPSTSDPLGELCLD